MPEEIAPIIEALDSLVSTQEILEPTPQWESVAEDFEKIRIKLYAEIGRIHIDGTE